MFLSTPVKIFPAALFLWILFAGCSVWPGRENPVTTLASQPKSEYPFSAREPDVFQADLIIRTGETERRISIARNGNMRRLDFDVGSDRHHAVMITDKEYLLFFDRMVFEDHPMATNVTSLYEPLTAHLLSMRDYASFTEINRDGPVVEYSARVNESLNSEVLIFFDESVGLPTRQEFYSIEGEQRVLQYSVEVRDFRKDVDPSKFRVPSEFRRAGPNRTP